MDPLRQPIELEFVPPKVGKPLSGLVAHLKQVDAYLDSINAKLGSGLKVDPKFTQSLTEINKKLNQTFAGRGAHSAEAMAKSLGLDASQTATILRRMRVLRSEMEGLSKRGMSFNTTENAAKGFAKAFDAEISAAEKRYANLGKLLTPTVREVAAQPVGGKASVSGIVPLLIDAKQIQATVAGMVSVVIPGSQVTGSAAGGIVRDPATGQIVSGGGGGGKGKSGGGIAGGVKGVPGSFANEAGRTLTQTEKGAKLAVETLIGGGQSLTKTFNDVGDEIKRVTKDPKLRNLGKQLREDLTVFRKQADADLLNTRTGDKVKDLLGVAKIKTDLADNVRKSFAAVEDKLPEPARKSLKRVYDTQARVFDAQAREAERLAGVETSAEKARRQAAAQKQANAYFERKQEERARDEARMMRGRRGDSQRMINAQAAMAMEDARINARPAPRKPGFIDKLFGGDGRMVTKGLTGFTPVGMAKNILTVGAWGMAVSAAMAPVQLAQYSMQRMLDVGLQTARLEQVFRGVGGSAKELADDVMQLASANGRSTEEAMDSAIAWSRLGLTRVQVNEAVRVSLQAANVAEVSAGEATEALSSIMMVYKLRVSELGGALAVMNAQSNTARVRVKDLLSGLSNVAVLGKQAGLALPELTAILSAGVETTGQSGKAMSQGLKSGLSRLARPDVQEYLSRRVGVETETSTGEHRSRSDVLRDMAVAWAKLTDSERENLAIRVAGAHQANRFAAFMDSYLRSQELAITSMTSMNSAMEENAKITSALKTQWGGLKSQWDRFVVRKGGPMLGELSQVVLAGRNVLGLTNRMGSLGGGGLLGTALKGPMGLVDASRKWLWSNFNKLFETDFDRGTAKFGNEMQELSMRADARGMQSRFYDSVSKVLGTKSGADAAERAAKLMAETGGPSKAFTAAFKRGDLGGARELLGQAGEQAREASLQATDELVSTRGRLLAIYQAEHDRLRAIGGSKEELVELEEKIAEVSQKKIEAQSRYVDLLQEGNEAVREHTQEVLNLIQQQDTALRFLEQMGTRFAPDTASGKMAAQAKVLQDQIAVLEDNESRLRTAKDYLAADATSEKTRQMRGQLADVTSPESRRFARDYDRQTVFGRRAEEDVERSGVGTTEAERLLQRERFLRGQLNDLQQRGGPQGRNLNAEDNARAHVFVERHYHTVEAIAKRIRDLAKEEAQARLEGGREFQKSLLFAGPGELLRKLTASRLAEKPMDAGKWFALSPEMRREVDTISGGEAMRNIREERNRLRGFRSPTAREEADNREKPLWEFDRYAPRSQPLGPAPTGLETVTVQVELNKVATAAQGTSYMLDTLTGKVTQLGHAVDSVVQKMGGQPTSTSGLNTGHSLGESPGIPGFQHFNSRGGSGITPLSF